MKNKFLIITADDYGYTPEVSKGIRDSIESGLVSCTSVMMNYISKEDASLIIDLRNKKNIGIGIHLNLSEGKSLSTDINFEPSLLNNLTFVKTELIFQLKKFREIFGEVDHINFHHHLHYDLRVMQEFLAIDEAAEIPIRFVNRIMRDILIAHKRKTPDIFVNVFPYNASSNDFNFFLKKAIYDFNNGQSGITEWMVHTGYTSTELERVATNYSKRREVELQLLCSSEVKEIIERNKIECRNFKQCF
ncbi:MAG: ChbG/HpnK family deacetylase [Saprospiraceae bacterium]|nr:ChbG/HpnK family deacetylase [Saprospiraceae bacterium]